MLPTRYGHTDFYAVAAQVMPILLLAIVFEQRLFRRRGVHLLVVALVASAVIALFSVSEAVALRVLYRGYAHRQDQLWVIVPMLIGALMLLAPVALGPIFELERSGKRSQARLAWVGVAVAGGFVGTVLLALFHQ